MIIPYLAVYITVGFCFLILPFLLLLIRNGKKRNIFVFISFAIYLVVLAIGVFGQIDYIEKGVKIGFVFGNKWGGKNIDYTFSVLSGHDIIFNIVMLLPLGIFIEYILRNKPYGKRIFCLVVFGFLCGALIETMQYILPITRTVQVSDAIFNMISTIIGGAIGRIYLYVLRRRLKN